MKKIDKFILTSFVGPFIAILLIVIFILMMQFLWLYIDELVGKGLSLKVILEFLGWGGATLLPLSLPLATLIASVMTLGTLGENNELLAIKAAGISLSRVLAPLVIVSAAISIGAFFAANDLIPLAYNKIFTLRDDIGRTKEEIKIPTGAFYDGIDGYILRVDKRNENTGMMFGVMVYNHTGNKGNTSLTIADSAMMKMSKDKSYLTFTMFSGSNYEETNTKKYRDTTFTLQKIEFRDQEMVIPLENYAFSKSDDTRFGDEARSMKLKQLRHQHDSIGSLDSDLKAKQTVRIFADKSLRYHNQLDTSEKKFADMPPFDFEGMMEWKNLESEISSTKRAITKTNEYIGVLSTFNREKIQYTFSLRRIDIETLKKFALAFACFIFFFIGAPLGALIRKGGLGTPAIIAVLFFVLYWVIDITGVKLAKDGAITAATGVFISSIVLLPIGMLFTWNAINDKSLIDTEKVSSLFKKLQNAVMGRLKKARIVYMGTPEFAVRPLDELIKKGFNVVGVVTVADKASGRGLKINESPVKKYAVEHKIPVMQPVSLKDPQFLAQLRAFKASIFVVVAFRMLPKEVWSMPQLGTINLHASLLPQYRGAAPINWAVIHGDRYTGVTSFLINEGMDTGLIVFRDQCIIDEKDNAGSLHDKLMELGANVVVQTIDAMIDGKVEPRSQKSYIQGDEILRPAPKITRELCHIDWDRPTMEIHNLIRGLSPYPAAFTELIKGNTPPLQLRIFTSSPLSSEETGNLIAQIWTDKSEIEGKTVDKTESKTILPGSIISDGKTFIAVRTADAALKLEEIQLAGKKRMSAAEFLNGFRNCYLYSTTKGTSSMVIDKYKCLV